MNLNFILENSSWLQGLGFISMVILFVVGFVAMFIGIFILADLYSLMLNKKIEAAILTNYSLRNVLGSLTIVVSVLGLTVMGFGTLRKSISEMDQKVKLESDYYVQIISNNKLSLLKKGFTEVKQYETTVVDGIEIEKSVKAQQEKYDEVSVVKCGQLSFDECLEKLKTNLGTITASVDDSMQVVQF